MEDEKKLVFGEEYDQQQEFTLIDEGDYELAIDKLEKRVSKAGNQCLNVTFIIRKDVDQKFQGRKVFYNLTKKADDPEGIYDFKRTNKLILTQKDKPTYRKSFADADEVLLYLNGIHLKAHIEIQFDEFNNTERNAITDYSFAPSDWDKKMQNKTAPDKSENLDKISVPSDSDLPW